MINRPFDSFAEQCNFGLAQVPTEWVLSLDADYELSDALVGELSGLRDAGAVVGYRAASSIASTAGRCAARSIRRASFSIASKERATRTKATATGWSIREPCARCAGRNLPRRPQTAVALARLAAGLCQGEADLSAGHGPKKRTLGASDRFAGLDGRRLFWYRSTCLLVKGCVLDGWAGWFYALQRLLAETMIALEVIDRRLRGVARARRPRARSDRRKRALSR